MCRYWQKYRIIYIFYQGGPIDHGTHIPGSFSQSSADSEYNAGFDKVMALEHFVMLTN